MKHTICTVSIYLTLLTFSFTVPSYACTLYSAAGSAVSDGGTLLAKVRDQKPENQYWYLVTPPEGYAYYGIFTQLNDHGLRDGLNEKGLVAVTSTVSTIPKNKRLAAPAYPGGTLKYILTHCGSVTDVLAMATKTWMSPQNIMIADKEEIAYIEIGLDGKYSVTRQQNGTLHHTNHFVNNDMQDSNILATSPSSLTRYNRISELLSRQKQFTFDDFIRFSDDRHNGPNNSIWRIGERSSVESLGALIVHISPSGAPEIYLKLRKTPDQKGKETLQHFTADQLFPSPQAEKSAVNTTPIDHFTFAFQKFFQGIYGIFFSLYTLVTIGH